MLEDTDPEKSRSGKVPYSVASYYARKYSNVFKFVFAQVVWYGLSANSATASGFTKLHQTRGDLCHDFEKLETERHQPNQRE